MAFDFFQCPLDHARTADADVDYTLALPDPVKRTGHERVVLYRIAEDYQLGAADGIAVFGALCGLKDNIAHQLHSVHVDSAARGADIDGGTHSFCNCQRFRNAVDQYPVALGAALLDQCREAADEVHANLFGRLVQNFGNRDIGIGVDRPGGNGDRSDRYPLVDDRHTELPLQIFAGFDQLLGGAGDFVIYILIEHTHICVGAVHQADSHRNGTDIQIHFPDHFIRFLYFHN
ncbi:hypothetical protein D3C75_895200 [compost metagenome]